MYEQAVLQYLKEHHHTRIEPHTAMFDMDGVLFDSMKNHAWAWHNAMQHFGIAMSMEEAYQHEGRTGAGTINIVSMRERGHEATEQEVEEIYEYKSQLFSSRPTAERMDGAYELLLKVKASGITPMVVTGSGQKSLLNRLQHNFPQVFSPDHMVTAFDVKYGKPNPEPYLIGLHKGGDLPPCQSIVVENAPLGVQAGVAAGVFTIAVNTGPLPDSVLLDEGANLLFPSMQALCDAWDELQMAFGHTHNP